jgi:hypothetical protein
MNLMHWSWQDIHKAYQVQAKLLNEYADAARRCGFTFPVPMGVVTAYQDPGERLFIEMVYVGVQPIERRLRALDAEIARRNKLIGVMG